MINRLTLVGAKSPRSLCWQDWFLMRAEKPIQALLSASGVGWPSQPSLACSSIILSSVFTSTHTPSPWVHVCVHISPAYKGTGHVGVGIHPTPL